MDGPSKMFGRNRFAVSDHSKMPSDTADHAALGESHIRRIGTAASAASAGMR